MAKGKPFTIVLKNGERHKIHAADSTAALNAAWDKWGNGRVSQVFEGAAGSSRSATQPGSRRGRGK